MSSDDMSAYDGQWVAMRDGQVVAHAPDEETLRSDPNVLPTDAMFPIGDPPMGYMVSA
jgi:hypothetical protein